MNQLESLKQHSTIVADTGDLAAIRQFAPQDATTNPSLILKSATDPRFTELLASAAANHHKHKSNRVELIINDLLIIFAGKILAMIPGRVSLEVSPTKSFNINESVADAKTLIEACAKVNIASDRILIKLAATWEGIQAAKALEREGIHCNLTLLFSFAQARACADAGVTLISPFVGRIYDWHCANEKLADIAIENDPGVASVARIFHHYKKHGYDTEIMGASFRKTEQIKALAGCDLMTISPSLLAKLQSAEGDIPCCLSKNESQQIATDENSILLESDYRYAHNTSAMAVEKLSAGIRQFAADETTLANVISANH